MSLNSRRGRAPCRVLALADDLSGAAEVASVLRLRARIALTTAGARPPADGEAAVLDLDTRQLPPADAARTVTEALRTVLLPADGVLLKKTDSLLRGNLAAETAAFAAGAAGAVIAPALPVNGRTVRGGIVHLDGVPLHRTDAWRAEPRPAPRSVADALGALPTAVVPLADVRAPLPHLADRLRTVLAAGRHPVCDAGTDADLDAIAAAAIQLGPGVRLVGTGGLAAAVGRQVGGRVTDRPPATPAPTPGRPLLVVVGTAEPTARAQIAQLTALGARHLALSADALVRPGGPPPLGVDPYGITVVGIDPSGGLHHDASRRLVTALARAVAAVPHPADLVLTGGETARRVLDALGIDLLRPVGRIHHGAVHSRTADGRSVVTRPGSYGGTDSLLRIARALRPHHGHAATRPPHQDHAVARPPAGTVPHTPPVPQGEPS
ncbi:four-carbon acid sugar kinase family protein [Streptomyces sclerotialus]|uniref:four-carbon acid sugar kinase family protein n=1 Tax=Streptomyces sclerotialus TaxID=1957 RepID=UPI0007C458C8